MKLVTFDSNGMTRNLSSHWKGQLWPARQGWWPSLESDDKGSDSLSLAEKPPHHVVTTYIAESYSKDRIIRI